jgi:hypothetical protein
MYDIIAEAHTNHCCYNQVKLYIYTCVYENADLHLLALSSVNIVLHYQQECRHYFHMLNLPSVCF